MLWLLNVNAMIVWALSMFKLDYLLDLLDGSLVTA